ncbi:predicted protein [Plenodomus lingam JN3]|uniref:Predicted protein n=1 Tax=Leptosphaeria maculans (strain JN3 / isolate v23.1.3 / race Av1-4-5-6-7-8) TaxID=985895 RepID=E4ZNH5_LEPMJ|nr:predicted protein [Plenodomus lingam JN3]CBX93034.1 predicted protein [Plenodomus lingam JN3]
MNHVHPTSTPTIHPARLVSQRHANAKKGSTNSSPPTRAPRPLAAHRSSLFLFLFLLEGRGRGAAYVDSTSHLIFPPSSQLQTAYLVLLHNERIPNLNTSHIANSVYSGNFASSIRTR